MAHLTAPRDTNRRNGDVRSYPTGDQTVWMGSLAAVNADGTLDAAIDTAIRRWMSRPMRHAEERYHDVPHGTPYLVAVVAICGMAE